MSHGKITDRYIRATDSQEYAISTSKSGFALVLIPLNNLSSLKMACKDEVLMWAEVASRLVSLGVPAQETQILTSAMVAADVLAARLPQAAEVLVVGGAGLIEAIKAVGLQPVSSATPERERNRVTSTLLSGLYRCVER